MAKEACSSVNGIVITYSITVIDDGSIGRRSSLIVADVLGHTCVRGIVAQSSVNIPIESLYMLWANDRRWRWWSGRERWSHAWIHCFPRLLSLRIRIAFVPGHTSMKVVLSSEFKLIIFILYSDTSCTHEKAANVLFDLLIYSALDWGAGDMGHVHYRARRCVRICQNGN